jgi:hypothetical protein
MARKPLGNRWSLTLSGAMWRDLERHLFPGDEDEHGAVIAAGIVTTPLGVRLLARDVFLARDGIDYVTGQRGYQMLTPGFVRDQILYCRDERLAYLAVHCHGGDDHVDFSPDDLASHERGYAALRDIAQGQVVGGLVFARNAVAGDLWLPDGSRAALSHATIVGRPIRTLYPQPVRAERTDATYDRQSRIFGDRGQEILSRQRVGVIGAGGAGSLVTEYLARLGVGHLVVIDPERIEVSNLPRIVDSSRFDALAWFDKGPWFCKAIARRMARRKVAIARRVARKANPKGAIEAIPGNVVDDKVARRLLDCDYLFLAADSMQARLVFNALVHQYLIPGVELGAKVTVDKSSGDILDVFSVLRPVTPDLGCLWCNGLISSAGLQEEALSEEERVRQRYVDDPIVVAPSVISLNAIAAAHAVDDFLFTTTGLLDEGSDHQFVRFLSRFAEVRFDAPRRDGSCRECGRNGTGRLARGDNRRLPTR